MTVNITATSASASAQRATAAQAAFREPVVRELPPAPPEPASWARVW